MSQHIKHLHPQQLVDVLHRLPDHVWLRWNGSNGFWVMAEKLGGEGEGGQIVQVGFLNIEDAKFIVMSAEADDD